MNLSSEDLNEVSEMVLHCMPAGIFWVLVMCPQHTAEEHSNAGYPLYFATNCDQHAILPLLDDTMRMLSAGTHGPLHTLKLKTGQ